MKLYAYWHMLIPETDPIAGDISAEIEKLNQLGREGWKAIHRNETGWYFMREYDGESENDRKLREYRREADERDRGERT